MKISCLFFVSLSVSLSKTFDSEKFLKNFCKVSSECLNYVKYTEVLCCENVKFTKVELEEIQTEDFVISAKERVFFARGDLGTVNSNFFNKFPNATEFSFGDSRLSLKSREEEAFSNSKLKKLNFYGTDISDNINSNAFHELNQLESLVLMGNNFEFKKIDSTLLKRSRNLKDLMIAFNRDKLTFDKDAFKNLFGLETLLMYNLGQTIPAGLIKNNTNLKYFVLASSDFTKVPGNIPGAVEVLNLSVNKIKVISRKDFETLVNLKELRLIYNGLEVIEEDSFDDLVNLETLSLSLNKLSNLTARHFERCFNLKWINLSGNEMLSDDVIQRLRESVKFDILMNKI